MIMCFTYIPVVSSSSVWLDAGHIFIHAYNQVYIPMHTNIHYDNQLYISSCIHMPTDISSYISIYMYIHYDKCVNFIPAM